MMHRDHRGTDPSPYTGPVPIVTHVHGAHTTDESDGYTEAWYLPAANNIPGSYAAEGTWYDTIQGQVPTPLRCNLAGRQRHIPVPQRPAGNHDVVS